MGSDAQPSNSKFLTFSYTALLLFYLLGTKSYDINQNVVCDINIRMLVELQLKARRSSYSGDWGKKKITGSNPAWATG